MKFFWGLLAIIFIKPIIGIVKFFWMIISFAVQLLFYKIFPNHSYLSQLDVTYKTPDLMSHFLPPHEVSFTFCCSSIVFPR
ncbi:ABC transporter membrane protein [Streptococcus pneumoniae]|nr:ABC transporter membrane protein [Streptococcus pneumoniae]VRH51334.1 ABC transporter membrane protein [Streptococcus pneumoniae]VRJ48024.1 ABC transporter membrane protein [Streptococcus pneumoniae]